MGKTSKPLKIGVGKEVWKWKEIQEMIKQGHDIKLLDLDRFDLVMSSNSRNMNERLKKYLPISVKDARKRRYGSKDKTTSSSTSPLSNKPEPSKPTSGKRRTTTPGR